MLTAVSLPPGRGWSRHVDRSKVGIVSDDHEGAPEVASGPRACRTSIGGIPVVVTTRSNARGALRPMDLGWVAFVAMAGLIARPLPAAAGFVKVSRVEFNRDIRPILSDNCYACHGPDKNRRKAKLRLDERASALASQAIVPGKPDESELVARVLSDDAEEVMPPPSTHK